MHVSLIAQQPFYSDQCSINEEEPPLNRQGFNISPFNLVLDNIVIFSTERYYSKGSLQEKIQVK